MMPVLIVLNAGSSSLKFQVYDAPEGGEPSVAFKGLFEGLGGPARFAVKDAHGALLTETTWGADDRIGHEEALMHLVSWLRQHQEGRKLAAVGHRVVHGGEAFSGPVLVDEAGTARSHREAPEIDGIIEVPTDLRAGSFVSVRIVDAMGPDLVAEPISHARDAMAATPGSA